MGLKSNQSEDELFSDEITELSNNRANPSLDKNVGGGGEVFHDLKDSHVSKDEKTAGKKYFRYKFSLMAHVNLEKD